MLLIILIIMAAKFRYILKFLCHSLVKIKTLVAEFRYVWQHCSHVNKDHVKTCMRKNKGTRMLWVKFAEGTTIS